MRTNFFFLLGVFLVLVAGDIHSARAQPRADDPAEAVIIKAVNALGGERYLKVETQIGRGRFSLVRDGVTMSFQSFLDVIVYPDKERTEFRGNGTRSIQTNSAGTGWIYDGDQDLIKVQTADQIASFKRGMRVSIDTLLRGSWRGSAVLTHGGRRPASLGKRNEVLKLVYDDGLIVEFEIAADTGIPAKAIHKRKNAEGEEIVEEDRYAQFVEVNGITAPFIIDRFTNGKHTSRINYETIEYNKRIPDSVFAKPSTPKDLKKDLKL